MSKLEKWRTYAELISQERDPARLMELAEKLNEVLEQEHPNQFLVKPSLTLHPLKK